MLITLKHKKVVDKFVKTLFYGKKHSINFTEWTYVVGAHRNCLSEAIPMCYNNICVYQQHMLLKLRKPILKYTLNK